MLPTVEGLDKTTYWYLKLSSKFSQGRILIELLLSALQRARFGFDCCYILMTNPVCKSIHLIYFCHFGFLFTVSQFLKCAGSEAVWEVGCNAAGSVAVRKRATQKTQEREFSVHWNVCPSCPGTWLKLLLHLSMTQKIWLPFTGDKSLWYSYCFLEQDGSKTMLTRNPHQSPLENLIRKPQVKRGVIKRIVQDPYPVFQSSDQIYVFLKDFADQFLTSGYNSKYQGCFQLSPPPSMKFSCNLPLENLSPGALWGMRFFSIILSPFTRSYFEV